MALTGRVPLVLIGGEADIGKIALAPVGCCYDLAGTPPYGLWAEALARASLADGSPPSPDLSEAGVASQATLFAAVRDFPAALAPRRPLVLLVEDLHWADPCAV